MANLLCCRAGLFRQHDVLSQCRGAQRLRLVTDFGINVLWHPSLGLELGDNVKQLLQDCVSVRSSSIFLSSKAPW